MLTSLCNHCYEEIPAELSHEEDGVWLRKECPVHGPQQALMDVDREMFSASLIQGAGREQWYNYIGVTALDVTDKCNVKCPHCYALPNNRLKDKSIDDLVSISRLATKANGLILMGAEPTMRNDLGSLVMALKLESGKNIHLCTNAIRLADQTYFDEHTEYIRTFCVSLHTRNYLGDVSTYDKKLAGLENIRKSGHRLGWVAFTLPTLDDIDEAINTAGRYKGFAHHIRIRSPWKTGICDGQPFYMSKLVSRFYSSMHARGIDVTPHPSDNNPYHMNFFADGQMWRLICGPSVETVVLEYLQTPPYALFVPELGETNLAHQYILQSGLKEGKAKLPSR